MADQSAEVLFKQAVAAARSRDVAKARELIQASIRKDPTNPTAWLVLASLAESKRNQLISLKKVLELEPSNKQALKMVRDLGVDPAELVQVQLNKPPTGDLSSPQQPEQSPPSVSPFREDALTDATPPATAEPEPQVRGGVFTEPVEPEPEEPREVAVPMPAPRPETFVERVDLYSGVALAAAEDFRQVPAPPSGVQWVKKDQNRAGENEIRVVRAAAATAIAVFGGVPLVLALVLLWNVPFVQSIVNPPTPTPLRANLQEPTSTPTPLTTPTITPGFTPTTSPTPEATIGATLTPTPTAPFPPGDPFNIVPTEIILPGGSGGRAEADAALFIAQGEYAPAIATVRAERDIQGEQAFNANLYYQEVRALIAQDELDEAASVLEEAETRRVSLSPNNTSALAALAAGRAELNLERGRAAQEIGNPEGASSFFSNVETEAEVAIRNESDWAVPYLLLAESHLLSRRYPQALAVIDRALELPNLNDDVRFYLLRAEIAYQQEDRDEALTQANLVLYADPASARAHELRTQIAIDRENYGTASLYSQTYLYYHPLTVEGWTTLGRIRLGEESPFLAIEALTQAIVIGENTPQPTAVEALVLRGGIYASRGQDALAYADIAAAADATDEPELRARQMELAYRTGDYTTARALLEELRTTGAISTGEANYMEARLIRAGGALVQLDYERITSLIDGGIGGIPVEQQPAANALRAEAYLALGNPGTAAGHINSALRQVQNPDWYLLRAQVYLAQGEFSRAILEYERARALAQLILPTNPEFANAVTTGIREANVGIEAAIATATAESAS